VKAAFTTAEMLLPKYRKVIEERFRCPVFNVLGCADGGYVACECTRHQGFHYNDLQSVLEVADPGEDGVGRLLITNLWNRSMPFVRYENGDQISLPDSDCPCGETFPMIGAVKGRTTDILRFRNGKSLAGPAITLIFRDMDIGAWQVVQRASDRLEVRICSREEPKQEDLDYIERCLDHHLGKDVQVDILHVDELETTSAGKLKPVCRDPAMSENEN
jgi:phenylacetate-CoA ligase